jgi:hypothetical protein
MRIDRKYAAAERVQHDAARYFYADTRQASEPEFKLIVWQDIDGGHWPPSQSTHNLSCDVDQMRRLPSREPPWGEHA